MRDSTHGEFVVRWANFVKNNPDAWREKHAEFINSQVRMNRVFLQRLKATAAGRKKIIALYDIKNLDGYKKLLKEN